jgi:AcrR family transcriptional regulator
MTTRRLRGSYAKTLARRQQIVDAAVEVFSANGFHNGSLREVADRVGISQAGLLYHFCSKESLLQAMLAWRDCDARRHLGEPFPQGIELIRGMVTLAEHNQATPGLVELHVNLSAEGTAPDHPLHRYFHDRAVTNLVSLREAFACAFKTGELKPGVDCAGAARTLTALMDGLQKQWLLDRNTEMATELRRYLQSLFHIQL